MKFRQIISIFSPDSKLWHSDLAQYGWMKRKLLFTLRVIRLVARGFMHDQCNLHASALTYYTLMSLVPLLALGLSLARVFGGGDIAREKISEEITNIGTQLSANTTESSAEMTQEFINHIREYADQIFDQIGNISFGTLGGVGLVVLLWMAITMLSQIERSFNSVWGAQPRKLWRKCSDYITIIIVVPFLGIAASTIPIVSMVTKFAYGYTFGIMSEEWLTGFLRFGICGIMTIALFTVVLMFVPNTKVKFKAGIIGGIVTAIFFFAWLKICTALQVGVVKYSKLYGGLASLPILLAWAYMSWQIILFGAELTFAVQHSESFFRDEGAKTARARTKWRLAIAIVAEMARKMSGDGGAFSTAEFVSSNGISGKLVADVMESLATAGIVAETGEDSGLFVLLKAPEKITVGDIFSAIVDAGTSPETLGITKVDMPVKRFFATVENGFSSVFAKPVTEILKV